MTNSANRSPSVSPAQATDVPRPTEPKAFGAGVNRTIAVGTEGSVVVTRRAGMTALGKSDMFDSLPNKCHKNVAKRCNKPFA